MLRAASNTRRRIPTLNISLIMGLMFFFVACNDDNPEAGPTYPSDNTNGNATRVYDWVTENPKTTDVHEAACRLEIPQLDKTGDNNLFIVHTTSDFGINYCMEYDRNLKAQRWSAFQSYAKNNVKNWNRNNWNKTEWEGDPFQVDPLIPQQYRTTLSDHRNNGHDRGHIMGSEDRVNSKDANEQTFYLSNIHPQLNSFNAQGIWYELENKIRNKYRQHEIYKASYFCDTLYVVKGGTIDNGNYTWVKGSGQKLVCPNYFFMAILRKSSKDTTQGGYAAIGFWMEHKGNTDTQYKNYAVTIDRLEQLTGIDFFCNLPDKIEEQVESNLVLSLW